MKNKIIIVPIEILKAELEICVGVSKDYFLKWHKTKKVTKEAKEVSDGIPDDFFSIKGGTTGLCTVINHKKSGLNFYFIHLGDWENSWDNLELLVHEIIHFKNYLFESHKISEEQEFESYFVEYVFKKSQNGAEQAR